MRHDIGVNWPDQSEETRHVDFVMYGNPFEYSAMAATVGFPTAIAAKMVLEGTCCVPVYCSVFVKSLFVLNFYPHWHCLSLQKVIACAGRSSPKKRWGKREMQIKSPNNLSL